MKEHEPILAVLECESPEEKEILDRIDTICKTVSDGLLKSGYSKEYAQCIREVTDLVYRQRVLLVDRVEQQIPCFTETVRPDEAKLNSIRRKYHLDVEE